MKIEFRIKTDISKLQVLMCFEMNGFLSLGCSKCNFKRPFGDKIKWPYQLIVKWLVEA